MSLGVDITIERDTATAAIDRAKRFVAPARVNAIVGTSGANTIQRHLYALNFSRPNRLGGTRTNFYLQAGKGTNWRQDGENAVVISIPSPGIAQRYFGGTIKAGKGISSWTGRPTKYLTQAARAESYGRAAGSFKDLVVLWGRNGPYALARANRTSIGFRTDKKTGVRQAYGRGADGGEILYWLKKEITQKPDPDVLPTRETMVKNIAQDVSEAFASEVQS